MRAFTRLAIRLWFTYAQCTEVMAGTRTAHSHYLMTLEQLLAAENIIKSVHKCGTGVRWKASVQRLEISKLRIAGRIKEQLLTGNYVSRGYHQFSIIERGVQRQIHSLHVYDRAVQKLFCNYALKPVVYPHLIFDNSASQENKGTDFALRRLKEHLRWHLARYGKTGAIAVLDYSKFFSTVPHDRAIQLITQDQTDERICVYISSFVTDYGGTQGLGLGAENSQLCAILYPTALDKFIKERLHIHCYGRYMDDSYIIHPDAAYVRYCVKQITLFAAALGITINQCKSKIHNLRTDDFTFLKKHVHITATHKIIFSITHKTYAQERRALLQAYAEYTAGHIPLPAIIHGYQARRCYVQKYAGYHLVHELDKLFTALFAPFFSRPISYAHPGKHALLEEHNGT